MILKGVEKLAAQPSFGPLYQPLGNTVAERTNFTKTHNRMGGPCSLTVSRRLDTRQNASELLDAITQTNLSLHAPKPNRPSAKSADGGGPSNATLHCTDSETLSTCGLSDL